MNVINLTSRQKARKNYEKNYYKATIRLHPHYKKRLADLVDAFGSISRAVEYSLDVIKNLPPTVENEEDKDEADLKVVVQILRYKIDDLEAELEKAKQRREVEEAEDQTVSDRVDAIFEAAKTPGLTEAIEAAFDRD